MDGCIPKVRKQLFSHSIPFTELYDHPAFILVRITVLKKTAVIGLIITITNSNWIKLSVVHWMNYYLQMVKNVEKSDENSRNRAKSTFLLRNHLKMITQFRLYWTIYGKPLITMAEIYNHRRNPMEE